MPQTSTAIPAALRVCVFTLEKDDVAELAEVLAASTSFHAPWVRYPTTAQTLHVYRQSMAEQGDLVFVARRQQDGVAVGIMTLNRVTRDVWQTAECSCAVGAAFAGQGYLAEGLRLLTHHAFRELGLQRLEALVRVDNVASNRMLASAGFSREGVSRGALLVDGRRKDHVRWAIIAADLDVLQLQAAEGGDL